MAVQISFSVNPTSRSGGRTLGRIRVRGLKISMKRTVWNQPSLLASTGLGSTTSPPAWDILLAADRKSTRLNSSHVAISYAVFCLKKKNRYAANQKEAAFS